MFFPISHLRTFLFFSIVACSIPFGVGAATTPSLGMADTYAVLASTYTNTSLTTINGDVGFTTPPAVVPLGIHPFYGSVPPYATAGIDQGIALALLNGQACDFNFGVATDLSLLPQPLIPGVYCITDAVTIGVAGITLSGAGTYIFRIDGAFDTTVNSIVTLTNGAGACDIFWTPTSATTLGADTIFKGTVIDDAGITVGANTSWEGRALTFGETVTTDSATITNSCIVAPAVLHVIKLVDNTSGGTAVASDFNLHVVLSGSEVPNSPTGGVVTPGIAYALYSGTYQVSEDTNIYYIRTFSGDCDASGNVILNAGDDKTCTVINTYIPFTTKGGGGNGAQSVDICLNGDFSDSRYDGKCAADIVVPTPINPNTTPNNPSPPSVQENASDAIVLTYPLNQTSPSLIIMPPRPALPSMLPETGASITFMHYSYQEMLFMLLALFAVGGLLFVIIKRHAHLFR